jgi:hypothetical protein
MTSPVKIIVFDLDSLVSNLARFDVFLKGLNEPHTQLFIVLKGAPVNSSSYLVVTFS